VRLLKHFATNALKCNKTDILDVSLIKLLQNQQGCNFYAPVPTV